MSVLTEEIKYRLDEHFQDAKDLECILNGAIHSLFLSQPDGGEFPKIGKVRVSRDNSKGHGNLALVYRPSFSYAKRFKYIQTVIGNVNLRNKTYSLKWEEHGFGHCKFNENFWSIPTEVMRDTEKVIRRLGL